MTIHIVWEFKVRPEQWEAFEAHYSSDGHWVELFRCSRAYIATTCAHDVQDSDRYLVTDVWESLEAYLDFKQKNQAEYEQLDKICQAFTLGETFIGAFQIGE